MNRRHTTQSTLNARIALTVIAWMLAIMMMTGCSKLPGFGPDAEEKPQAKQQSGQTDNAETRKQDFFARMKPLVEKENARISDQRERVIDLRNSLWLSQRNLTELKQLAASYKIELADKPTDKQWNALLARIDIIPVEMALVQAANESAWGTSRFAKQGNNYFGQWCYQKGCGIVPKQRKAGATHEVQRFASASESVAAYMHNINTTSAYSGFRDLRGKLRKQRKPLDAEQLALGLKSYSERGMAYVKTIRTMIRSNRELIEQS